MAWRCSGRTNAGLVNNLRSSGIIKTPTVYDAMISTDRGLYTSFSPYDDAPQLIPRPSSSSSSLSSSSSCTNDTVARVTISAPHMHAYALETLAPYLSASSKVLDVGCGSGYLTACLSRMICDAGVVVGIDHAKYLVELATRQVRSDGDLARRIDWGSLRIVYGDGRRGYLPHAPYSVIHVGAAAATVPQALLDQLDSPGIMFIPVGEQGGEQWIYIIKKDKHGVVSKDKSHGVRYVPLTDSDDS